MFKHAFFVGVFFASSLTTASALSGNQIAQLITNKTLILKTSYGKFPLRYKGNKTVTGDGSKTGLARFFAPKETGKWWTTSSSLCQRWPTWYDGKPFCFTVERVSKNKIRWVRDDGYTGTAEIRD